MGASAPGQSRARSLASNLAALAAGTFVMALLVELVLRIAGLGHPYYSAPEAYVPVADQNVLFTLRPSFNGFSEGTSVQVNGAGLRERELTEQRQPGLSRVLFLGDSVTFGAGVTAEEAFPRLLESRLPPLPGRQIQTINAGVVGYNTTQELARLRDLGPRYQPDIVVLTFVVNDLLDSFSIFDHQYDPTGPTAPLKIWLRRNSHAYRFVQNTYWRVALEVRRSGVGTTEANRPRARVEERLRELTDLVDAARAGGAAMVLVLYPDNLDDRVSPGPDGSRPTMREVLTEFAQARRVALVDLTAALGDVRDPRAREHRLREDPHPSPLGHRVIAEALTPTLRQTLDALQRR
ncbi:MAG: GDSL-type esterase/lipase family protein [Chloroflexota bacterium]